MLVVVSKPRAGSSATESMAVPTTNVLPPLGGDASGKLVALAAGAWVGAAGACVAAVFGASVGAAAFAAVVGAGAGAAAGCAEHAVRTAASAKIISKVKRESFIHFSLYNRLRVEPSGGCCRHKRSNFAGETTG